MKKNLIGDALVTAIFKANGTSVDVNGVDITYPPIVHKLSKGKGNLAALLRMLLLFAEVDGDPIRESVAYCRSLEQENYTITNAQGFKLQGTLYKAAEPTDKYVFFSHGYNMTGLSDGSRCIRAYNKMGLNVFTVDHRHEGTSEGDYVTFGAEESKDCIQWLKFLEETFGSDIKVLIHGISMGSTTAMLTCANDELPEVVKCCVADCGYTSAKDEFNHVLRAFHLPKMISAALALYVTNYFNFVSGYDLGETSVPAVAYKIKVPVLMMHGDDDIFVPHTMSEQNFDCLMCEKELHLFPGAQHSGSQHYYPEEYYGYCKAYVDKYLVD